MARYPGLKLFDLFNNPLLICLQLFIASNQLTDP